ncbi:NINE protein, partial [Bacteroides thetaiotaomicron]|nr:NINE protein [Bacteroides thetaiotaomicron]
AALAFLLGSLGAHRFYLYGFRDVYGWAHLLATIVGIPGFLLLAASQRTAGLGWWLAVPGAISLLAAFLAALVYGLRPDE